ncbi:DUF2231 domain-containing protein [Salinicola avicenniae]|uniref:DUF2231 domain-containing protein n=1 Tax=Salinicola avicenniae TaxID=2916836 RepID=UPI002074654E|nr:MULTISPECIES: DUF2231 domain-containing protein [unclassified Salinicola]
MTATEYPARRGVNPLQGVLLAGSFPLYLGAALSDYAYATTFEIQWANFASWLIAGGLVFNGLALLGALIGLLRGSGRRKLVLISVIGLLIAWVLGFINALIHARDAWAMMPTGFALSIVITILAAIAAWVGFSRASQGGEA